MRKLAMVLAILITMCTCTEASSDVSATVYVVPNEVPMVAKERIESNTKSVEELYDLGDKDKYLLAKIAMAEAEGEDIKGKALVIMTVLNRIDDDRFPDTIDGVIFQEGQFSPISDGRWDSIEPNDQCWEALDMVIGGWNESQDALYFESCPSADNWHSNNLNYLFTHDGHRFYN